MADDNNTAPQGFAYFIDLCIPNAETIAAIEELEAGEGKTYRGSTRKIFNRALRE